MKKKKPKCESCGGIKPKEMSPRTKARMKKKQMLAKLKASNQSEEGFVSQTVKAIDCPPII